MEIKNNNKIFTIFKNSYFKIKNHSINSSHTKLLRESSKYRFLAYL